MPFMERVAIVNGTLEKLDFDDGYELSLTGNEEALRELYEASSPLMMTAYYIGTKRNGEKWFVFEVKPMTPNQ